MVKLVPHKINVKTFASGPRHWKKAVRREVGEKALLERAGKKSLAPEGERNHGLGSGLPIRQEGQNDGGW